MTAHCESCSVVSRTYPPKHRKHPDISAFTTQGALPQCFPVQSSARRYGISVQPHRLEPTPYSNGCRSQIRLQEPVWALLLSRLGLFHASVVIYRHMICWAMASTLMMQSPMFACQPCMSHHELHRSITAQCKLSRPTSQYDARELKALTTEAAAKAGDRELS